MTLGYHGDLAVARWNPPPPPITQVHQSLIAALAKELAGTPIQQQTVIIAVHHADEDAWRVDILKAPPPRGCYDGWRDCQIDFDQYYGTVEEIRRSAAEDLAEDLMNQALPAWRNIREFGPAWDADPPDLD